MKSLLIAIVFLAGRMDSQDRNLGIIPTPQQSTPKPLKYKIGSSTRIILGDGTTIEDGFAAAEINRSLGELSGFQLKVVHESAVRKISSNFIFIGTPRNSFGKQISKERGIPWGAEMRNEGYYLDIDPGGIMLLADSSAGRFYGAMTLLQLIRKEKKSVVVPGATVRDWPLQSFRGVSDDVSRGQVSTQENFKKIIRFLARYKLNVYSPYLEDMVLFKSHPQIGKTRGALSASEIRDIDSYAKKYHVQITPIFETLGHWENILMMPEYAKYAEFPGAHTLNISDEAVYVMLDQMISELSQAFSSPYFNIAADESWDVGLGANKQRVAASDIATVHAEHYKRVFEMVGKYGKKPMMYGDIILRNPTILQKIPRDVVMVDWHYGAQSVYPSPEIFKSAGFPFVVSPAVMNFTGPFPNYVNTFVNIQNLNRDGYIHGSLGLLTSTWNDYGGEALRELNEYGYAWTAECAWQPLNASLEQFNRNFFSDFFGSELAAAPAQAVYAILSDPLNLIDWNDLWRHPMLPLRPSSLHYLWRVQSIESTMPLVQRLLEDIKTHATRNKDHIQYLEFITKMNLWYYEKLKVGEAVRTLTQDPLGNKDSIRTVVFELTKTVVPHLLLLKDDFKSKWLTTNREANLQWLLERYDRQGSYWKEKIDEVSRGNLWVDPLIPSQWIYHPNANPWKRDSTLTQVPTAYFMKSFEIAESPASAKLQLMGDSQARVWLDSVSIGEVFARRSLSLGVERQRVKVWDVGKLLRKGTNTMLVEAKNYGPFGSGGFNLLMEMQASDGTASYVFSDSTWKVSTWSGDSQNSPGRRDSAWIQAKPFAYPLPVIRPNLGLGRGSWIER